MKKRTIKCCCRVGYVINELDLLSLVEYGKCVVPLVTSKTFPFTATKTRPSGPVPLYCFSCSIVMSCFLS